MALVGVLVLSLAAAIAAFLYWVVWPVVWLVWTACAYVFGRVPLDVLRAHAGETYLAPEWVGPAGTVPYSPEYVQDRVRGRNANRSPLDLIVVTNQGAARLKRGDGRRGRSDRHGYIYYHSEVLAGTSGALTRALAATQVHLCASDPCTAPDAAAVHALRSAVVDPDAQVDLAEIAGRGPRARCYLATRLMYAWMRARECWCKCRCPCRKRLRRGGPGP